MKDVQMWAYVWDGEKFVLEELDNDPIRAIAMSIKNPKGLRDLTKLAEKFYVPVPEEVGKWIFYCGSWHSCEELEILYQLLGFMSKQ